MNQVKCKVVMLPTEKASHIFLEADKKTIRYNPTILSATGNLNDRYQCQHLYILSDEEIKEGDWCIANAKTYNNTIVKYMKSPCPPPYVSNLSILKKIIASTDESLGLPRPSNSFIKKYCELGGINEIMVDYEDYYTIQGLYKNKIVYPKLKVAPDNTITIHHVIERTYTKEEMRQLAIHFKFIGGNEKDNCWLSHHNEMFRDYLENI